MEDLKEIWDFSKGGDLPVRSEGSCWISQKRKALQRLVDRYSAYIHHLTTLAKDQSMKSTDRSRLKGYVMKWKQSRVLIGAAMYVDVLKAPSLLSVCLQEEKADIVHGIQQLLKSSKSLKKLAGQDPLLWPTVKLVCDRVKEEGEEKVYQGVVLSNYNPIILNSCAAQALADINQLQKQLQARLEWSDVKMLMAILVFLDTQSWQPHSSLSATNDENSDLAEIREAVEYITCHFREPLEAKGITMTSIQDEIEEIVLYARKYLGIDKEGYQKIGKKCHNTPECRTCNNKHHPSICDESASVKNGVSNLTNPKTSSLNPQGSFHMNFPPPKI